MPAEPNHIAARAGIAAVVCNLAGVFALTGIDQAYQPGGLDRWYYAATQHVAGQGWSAWLFAVGVLLLVPWAAGLTRVLGPYAWPGGAMVITGAALNVLGSLLPFVVVTAVPHGEASLGQTLLGLALVLDAMFNLALGIGIVMLSFAMARDHHFPMWMSGLGLLAGMATAPVVSQAWSPLGGVLLMVAGPLWLGWVVAVSFRLTNLKWESWDSRRSAPELNRLPLATPMDRSGQAGGRADDRPSPAK